MDTRWRYGVFLGRSAYSDQKCIGLEHGSVVRAKAITRVIPQVRWILERLLGVTTTPLNENQSMYDGIETTDAPHDHIDEPNTPQDEQSTSRRVPIHLKDLQAHGFTPGCPKCGLHEQGEHKRAQMS